MKTNPNDPAQPILTQSPSLQNETSLGLTKLEDFAKSAMIGLISNAPDGNLSNSKEGAALAVQWARDLIEALNKED